MNISYEYVPENYVGNYPYAIIRLKKSQKEDLQLISKIEEAIRELPDKNYPNKK
jgi:hypothetical protein